MTDDDKPVVLQAMHYAETERRLMGDPIVRDMAEGVRHMDRADLAHDTGTPRHEFTMAANDEYRKRGGTDGGHLGAIATAILNLLDDLFGEDTTEYYTCAKGTAWSSPSAWRTRPGAPPTGWPSGRWT
jgi:hypothetical protein